jgi:hypothetical protein
MGAWATMFKPKELDRATKSELKFSQRGIRMNLIFASNTQKKRKERRWGGRKIGRIRMLSDH